MGAPVAGTLVAESSASAGGALGHGALIEGTQRAVVKAVAASLLHMGILALSAQVL